MKIPKIKFVGKRKAENTESKINVEFACFLVVRDGIEPPTQGFSVLCSTN